VIRSCSWKPRQICEPDGKRFRPSFFFYFWVGRYNKTRGPWKTCTLSRSKLHPVPPAVPFKRKLELCKFLSEQKFVRTRVNGASLFPWDQSFKCLFLRGRCRYGELGDCCREVMYETVRRDQKSDHSIERWLLVIVRLHVIQQQIMRRFKACFCCSCSWEFKDVSYLHRIANFCTTVLNVY